MWKMAQKTELSVCGCFPKVINQINHSLLEMEEWEDGDPWNCALEDFSSWKDRVQEEVCPTPPFHILMSISDLQSNKQFVC